MFCCAARNGEASETPVVAHCKLELIGCRAATPQEAGGKYPQSAAAGVEILGQQRLF